MADATLARLQRQLTRALTDPKGPGAHLHAKKGSLKGALIDAPPLPLAERMEIYSFAFSERLVEALELDFPRTRKALGVRRFREVARAYLTAHPSREWSVSFVGRNLPGFLKRKLKGKAARAVAMAHLDWAEILAFFAENEKAWDPSELASLSPESQGRVRLKLAASVFLLGKNEGFGARPRLVWREGFQVRGVSLNGAQAALIESFKRRRPLSSALSKLPLRAQAQAAFWIQNWAAQGVFSGAEL